MQLSDLATLTETRNLQRGEWDIIGGYDLGRYYPHLQDHMLLCVTEMNPREEIDALVEVLREATE